MKRIEYKYPKSVIYELSNKIIPEDISIDSLVELSIKIDDKNVNVREFGAFLTFLDKIYGRIQHRGIYHYAHHPELQLEIVEIKKGSIELIIQSVAEKVNVELLFILYLVIKYLPSAIGSLMNFWKNYEETRLARMNRKLLKEQLKEEEKLKNLQNDKFNRLIRYLEFIITKDKDKLSSSSKFIQKNIIDVKIKIVNKK